MSSYLVIKKDGVTIGEWSRNTEMYKAFRNAPWDDEEEFDPEKEFSSAEFYIKEKIDDCNKTIGKYNKMLEGNLDYEDRWGCISELEDYEEALEELKRCIYEIQFMRDCWECDRWEDNPVKWTWSVG